MDVCTLGFAGVFTDRAEVNDGDHIEHRVERAVFETDRHVIVGDVTLPPEGYQSRFSDVLNRRDFDFLPLTNVEITTIADDKVTERPFMVLSKSQVRIAYPFYG
jgi:hypothetical protein